MRRGRVSTRSSSSGPSWRTRVSPSRSPRRRMSARSSLLVGRGSGRRHCSQVRLLAVLSSSGGAGGCGPRCPTLTQDRCGAAALSDRSDRCARGRRLSGLLPPVQALPYLRCRRLRIRRPWFPTWAPHPTLSPHPTGDAHDHEPRCDRQTPPRPTRRRPPPPPPPRWAARRSARSSRSPCCSSSPSPSSPCSRRCRWPGAGA